MQRCSWDLGSWNLLQWICSHFSTRIYVLETWGRNAKCAPTQSAWQSLSQPQRMPFLKLNVIYLWSFQAVKMDKNDRHLRNFESALGACHVWCAFWNRAAGPLWRPEMLNLDAGTQPASWAKLRSSPFGTCFLRLPIRAIPRFHPSDSEEPMHMVSFGDRTSPSRRRWAEVAEGPVVWGFGYCWVVDI